MKTTASFLCCLAMIGCASVPIGPRVPIMPGAGKTLDQFTQDDHICRDWTQQSLGTDVNKAGVENVAVGTGVGTLLGAAAGALLGGHRGAAGGAAGGAVLGTAVGAGNAANVQGSIQQRYDIAYQQCMATKGNQPVAQRSYAPYSYRSRPNAIYQAPPQTLIIQQAPPALPGADLPPPPQ